MKDDGAKLIEAAMRSNTQMITAYLASKAGQPMPTLKVKTVAFLRYLFPSLLALISRLFIDD